MNRRPSEGVQETLMFQFRLGKLALVIEVDCFTCHSVPLKAFKMEFIQN